MNAKRIGRFTTGSGGTMNVAVATDEGEKGDVYLTYSEGWQTAEIRLSSDEAWQLSGLLSLAARGTEEWTEEPEPRGENRGTEMHVHAWQPCCSLKDCRKRVCWTCGEEGERE